MSNLGAKMSYTETAQRDFIPSNLRIGAAYETEIDDYNSVTVALDANKLLVPTQPIYALDDPSVIISGMDPNVGVANGIIQSFYDAPGIVTFDNEGEATVVQGSRLKEELREVNLGAGVEYNFADVFAFRSGYFLSTSAKAIANL